MRTYIFFTLRKTFLISSYSVDIPFSRPAQLRFFYLVGTQSTCDEMVNQPICLLNIAILQPFCQPELESDHFIFPEISSSTISEILSSLEGFIFRKWLKNLQWSSGNDLCTFISLVITFLSEVLYYNLAVAHFNVGGLKLDWTRMEHRKKNHYIVE